MSRQRPTHRRAVSDQQPSCARISNGQEEICAIVRDSFGSDAAGLVAYAALDAWFEGEDEEFKGLATLFSLLRN